MDSLIYLHADGAWQPAATLTVTGHRVRFEYLPEYVFGGGLWPVALGLPVNMEIITTTPDVPATPLAFLWDLVPQGRGRQHLANLLGVPEQGPAQDLFLAQHGSFAPIGRLRMDTALRFYEAHVGGHPAPGFTLEDMVERTDVFLEQLTVHSMLAAGTPGVQGVAPKFLLTQDEEGRWFPDMVLTDARARALDRQAPARTRRHRLSDPAARGDLSAGCWRLRVAHVRRTDVRAEHALSAAL